MFLLFVLVQLLLKTHRKKINYTLSFILIIYKIEFIKIALLNLFISFNNTIILPGSLAQNLQPSLIP